MGNEVLFREGIEFVGARSGVRYRVLAVSDIDVSLKVMRDNGRVLRIPRDILMNMDIVESSICKKPYGNILDFRPTCRVGELLGIDSRDLWDKFCIEYDIIGVSQIWEEYLPEHLKWPVSRAYGLFDHMVMCMDREERVLLVCCPYLSDAEIAEECKRFGISAYDTLGVESSFYYPGRSNLVVVRLYEE